MNLAKEAAYLYLYSKELLKINRKLKRLSKKAEKHAEKHRKATEETKKAKHAHKHQKVTKKIRKLMTKHNEVLGGIRHHMVNFHEALRKQHHI